jgi:hypothetical protein
MTDGGVSGQWGAMYSYAMQVVFIRRCLIVMKVEYKGVRCLKQPSIFGIRPTLTQA